MKKVKNYIDADLAKKKIARYRYWTIKDENGITIISSDDNPNNQSFEDVLDKIIADNVDAEIQVRFGTNDQSSRQNTPLFIRVNESIEWIEPEDELDETIKVNGVPHKLDKNGNVNINLNTPEPSYKAQPQIENGNIDFFRQEMEMQLQGLRREHELKEEKMQVDLQNKLFEQTLKFKEMMLADRENRINEREQQISQREASFEEKEKELQGNVKGYIKQIVPALGGLAKEFLLKEKDKGLSGTDKENKSEKTTKQRRKVNFSFNEDEPELTEEEIEAEIAQYEDVDHEEVEHHEEHESNTNQENTNKNEEL